MHEGIDEFKHEKCFNSYATSLVTFSTPRRHSQLIKLNLPLQPHEQLRRWAGKKLPFAKLFLISINSREHPEVNPLEINEKFLPPKYCFSFHLLSPVSHAGTTSGIRKKEMFEIHSIKSFFSNVKYRIHELRRKLNGKIPSSRVDFTFHLFFRLNLRITENFEGAT